MGAEHAQPAAVKYMLLPVVALAFVWSGIAPHDYPTWFFELFVGLIGVAVLVAIAPRFRFSTVLYAVVAVHFVILAVGAKYTYAEEPFFNWLRETLGLSRNHFDRVGHFAQGFTPALVTREILIRRTGIGRGWIVGFLSICVALAFSAMYEILECFWVLAFYPDKGPEWLGMQDDPWDAQWDMVMALWGAVTAIIILSGPQNRSMAGLSTYCNSDRPIGDGAK
jgi:putative membrane protein